MLDTASLFRRTTGQFKVSENNVLSSYLQLFQVFKADIEDRDGCFIDPYPA